MTESASFPVFEALCRLLDQHQATYRVVYHANAGKSEEVARIRGTEVGQGAKALVCEITGGKTPELAVLAVLPADRRLDLKHLAELMGGTKGRLADPDTAFSRTGCKIGTIPPFSFSPELILVVDPELAERHDIIAFNAGRLDASILLDSRDYLSISQPRLERIAQRDNRD